MRIYGGLATRGPGVGGRAERVGRSAGAALCHGYGRFVLVLRRWQDYLLSEEASLMDGRPEPDLLNRRDLAWEARMVAEAEAEIAAC